MKFTDDQPLNELLKAVFYNDFNIDVYYKYQQDTVKRWYKAQFMKSNRWNKKAIFSFLRNFPYMHKKFKEIFIFLFDNSKSTNKQFIEHYNNFFDQLRKEQEKKDEYQIYIKQDAYHDLIKLLGSAKREGKITNTSYTQIARLLIRNFTPEEELSVSSLLDRLSDRKAYTNYI
ncbi:hypothetical protein [Carboxylicivirga sp. RSCT41]|uniref:hypothetical protein n=1 Tax=Carboxylicivirga agarovorans TaxID=3417570 RepID=UPI003D350241